MTRVHFSTAALLCLALLLASAGEASTRTPAKYRRSTEQTFLTFPEWFLVHSPAEYAALVQNRWPSEFPFIRHTGQFWGSYGKVWKATRPYPFNTGYHVMILVIGVSTTVEYAIRSAYETLVGRVSEAAALPMSTAEDRVGATVAQEYVDFIRVRPWYEFDFNEALVRLWSSPLSGPHQFRKWERRYALTSEYGVKALYGWLIMKGTRATYGVESEVTAVVVERLPPAVNHLPLVDGSFPKLAVIQRFEDGSALVTVPRYEAFKNYAMSLAMRGALFEEIAGNESIILVTLIVPSDWSPGAGESTLFTQPIITRPGRKRVAVIVPVRSLASFLRAVPSRGGELEHVYDY